MGKGIDPTWMGGIGAQGELCIWHFTKTPELAEYAIPSNIENVFKEFLLRATVATRAG
jgi:hypothetical protein